MGTRILIIVLFVLSVLTSSALTLMLVNNSQKNGSAAAQDVGAQVAKFIEENPEVIINSLKMAQAKRAEREAAEGDKLAISLRPQLEGNEKDPQKGSKDGDVTIVAFHDHNCGYCRRSIPDIEKIVSEDNKVRFVLKDFPILGPLSVEKAKASIAVAKLAPEKWFDFYDAMGKSNAQTAEQVIDLAKDKIGLDPTILKTEMESKDTSNKISENHALGEQLGISGTPVFIVNGKMIRGAAGYDAMKAAVAAARAGK